MLDLNAQPKQAPKGGTPANRSAGQQEPRFRPPRHPEVTGPSLEVVTPLKAVVDFALALVLLVLLAPIMVIAGLLVKLTSPGPALYVQTRVGKGGRLFRIYKLRTMHHDCEKVSGARWSAPGDPRVTALGRFLRRTHLDELPQLINVLKGDMSLVGPRPERPEFVAALELQIPLYRERLAVRPGVTGLAQVYLPPDSDLNSVCRKLVYDLHYIRHMSPWLDLRLMVCTGLQMLAIPFRVLRWLLRLPTVPAIEGSPAHETLVGVTTTELKRS